MRSAELTGYLLLWEREGRTDDLPILTKLTNATPGPRGDPYISRVDII